MSCGYIINQSACSAFDNGWGEFNDKTIPPYSPSESFTTVDEDNCYIYIDPLDSEYPSGIIYREIPITKNCKYTFNISSRFLFNDEAIPNIAGTIQLLGYNSPITDPNDYDVLATYEMPNVNDNLAVTTFSFTAEQNYDVFAWNIIGCVNGSFEVFYFQLEQYCCDETTETSDQYLVTQEQVEAAIEKAKCCYGTLKSEQLQRLKDGLEVCEETNKNLTLLDMSIFVLSRYCKGGCNCIGDNDAYYKIEVINNICGCANC
jgi:hypothetical protein